MKMRKPLVASVALAIGMAMTGLTTAVASDCLSMTVAAGVDATRLEVASITKSQDPGIQDRAIVIRKNKAADEMVLFAAYDYEAIEPYYLRYDNVPYDNLAAHPDTEGQEGGSGFIKMAFETGMAQWSLGNSMDRNIQLE